MAESARDAGRLTSVVRMDLRGTGRSTGCLDHLGKLTGNRRRIRQFAINPELRNSTDMGAPTTATPVVAGERMTLRPPAMAMAHNLREGHKLGLRVTASDPDKVPTFAVDPLITVYTGPRGTVLRVPQVITPTPVADTVPFETVLRKKAGTAQPAITQSVTPLLPGPDAGQPVPPASPANTSSSRCSMAWTTTFSSSERRRRFRRI